MSQAGLDDDAGVSKAARDPTRLDGFEAHFATEIEPPVRLPRGLGVPSPRSNAFAVASVLVLLGSGAAWLLDFPVYIYGLGVVAGAGLVLAAIQLRMGGHGMSLAEARNHVVGSVAAFLGLEHRRTLGTEDVHELLGHAGRISPTGIMQVMDGLRGGIDDVRFDSLQVLGAVSPDWDGQPEWFAMPVALLTRRYTIDGLLARIELPLDTGVRLTVSSDRRLAHRDHETAPLLTLLSPEPVSDAFDEEFRLVAEASDADAPAIGAPAREVLAELSADLGPLTLYLDGRCAYLSIWAVGDVYELTSLGMALEVQCRRLATIMAAPARLGRALVDTYESA